jgi:hypothetical protein
MREKIDQAKLTNKKFKEAAYVKTALQNHKEN